MYRKTRVMILTAVLVLFTAQPAFADVEDSEEQAFLNLLSNYLSLSEKMADIAAKSEITVYLAMEGIVEIYEDKGEKAKAIPELEKILTIFKDNQAIRNLTLFKLRDLYNETGRSDLALKQLNQVIAENNRR